MNQKGHSWPEAILTLGALVVIFGTLLPVATNMTSTLNQKKMAMHASETAFRGTIAYHASGKSSGLRQVDGIDYEWHVELNAICVVYKGGSEVTTKCLNY